MPSTLWFRLVVEAAPNAMLLVDRAGKIVLVNRGAETLFGYPREELLGERIERLIPARFRDAHPGHVERFVADPKARAMGAGRDLAGLRKDGTEVPVEIGLNPIETPNGSFVLASVIDITERKRVDTVFRAVVEAAPSAMIMVDAARTITLVNHRTEVLFGYTRDELIGASLELLVPEEARERHPAHVADFLSHPEARAMGAGRELFGRRKDGTVVPIEIGLNPIEIPDSGSFTLASIIDISERKRAQDELRRSNAELEQFAYIASHDLQEPLRMVASYTELLAQRYRGQLDERADKYIHYAVDGAQRMQQLVMDLLAYSRIGFDAKELETVDCNVILEQVLRMLGRSIRETCATVTFDPLPTVHADPSQLTQVLQNLVGNAIKFCGDTPTKVHVGAVPDAGGWRFSVADDGIGIEPQHGERIFQMFQRLHDRSRYAGTGIGLAIAKRIVERHGGRIWFESEPGVGTTFFFTLRSTPATEVP